MSPQSYFLKKTYTCEPFRGERGTKGVEPFCESENQGSLGIRVVGERPARNSGETAGCGSRPSGRRMNLVPRFPQLGKRPRKFPESQSQKFAFFGCGMSVRE
jgi:hypothetical protein